MSDDESQTQVPPEDTQLTLEDGGATQQPKTEEPHAPINVKEEMASEERKADQEKIKAENMAAGEPEAETDVFQCGRCKQWKTRYRQQQVRSDDEPMTTFVTCTNCNNRWKFC